MTYAQSKGHHNIDWPYFLDHPPQTADGWKLAEEAAFSKIQGLGGCLPVELRRKKKNGQLWDHELRGYDARFWAAITEKNIGTAKECLKRSNERAAQLLQTKKQTA